jgi:hypothetical protein
MIFQASNGRWRQCAGCGRERRLNRAGTLIRVHNRWDSASWAMVACEGSGQEPVQGGPRLRVAEPAGRTA